VDIVSVECTGREFSASTLLRDESMEQLHKQGIKKNVQSVGPLTKKISIFGLEHVIDQLLDTLITNVLVIIPLSSYLVETIIATYFIRFSSCDNDDPE
jgi:hypothetical protein